MFAMVLLVQILAQGLDADTQAALQPYMNEYVGCLVGAARRLDDHVSDAATIAKAIHGDCPAQLANYVAKVKAIIPAQRSSIDGAADEISVNVALQAVLLERRGAFKN